MFLQSETINGEIQVVLFNDLEKPIAIMPYIVDDDGEKKLVIPQSVEDYIEGQLTGEPQGYEDDVLRDVKKVLDKYYFSRTPIQELHKKYFRKNIPEPPVPAEPPRPHKVKRPLEPKELKPPVLPKDMLEKLAGAKR